MTEELFEQYVQSAIDSLPNEFKEKLNNVAIVIEDYPSDVQLRSVGIQRGRGMLLGLYQGIPQPRRGAGYGVGGTLPDKITIFKYPILSIAQSEEDIKKMVRNTVLHEIAHHFGMNEEEVRKAERNRIGS